MVDFAPIFYKSYINWRNCFDPIMSHTTTNCVWSIIFLVVVCLWNKIWNLWNFVWNFGWNFGCRLASIKCQSVHQRLSGPSTFSSSVSWWRVVIWSHHTFIRIHGWSVHYASSRSTSTMSLWTSSRCWLLFWRKYWIGNR